MTQNRTMSAPGMAAANAGSLVPCTRTAQWTPTLAGAQLDEELEYRLAPSSVLLAGEAGIGRVLEKRRTPVPQFQRLRRASKLDPEDSVRPDRDSAPRSSMRSLAPAAEHGAVASPRVGTLGPLDRGDMAPNSRHEA